MTEWTSNNRRIVNSVVKPSIVLWSDTETLIAQNAHNYIWDLHWEVCDGYDKLIARARKYGEDTAELQSELNAIIAIVKVEIDIHIKEEIDIYRAKRSASPFAALEDEIEELKNKLIRIENEVREAQDQAFDAQSRADEAYDMAEEANDGRDDCRCDDLEGRIDDLEAKIDTLENKIDELEERLENDED